MGGRFFTHSVFLLLIFWAAKVATENRLSKITREEPRVTLESARFHSRSLQQFALGFDTFLADLAWVELLQAASHEKLVNQEVSWEYAKLLSITTLDRRFSRAYSFGASFISIFRQDKNGALEILRRWVTAEPRNWWSHYALGFHLFHEMDLPQEGAKHLLRAAELPSAPAWLTSLGIRLMSTSGSYFSSLQTTLSLYDSIRDEEGKNRLRARIRSLVYNLQKNEWEETVQAYRKTHGRTPASLEGLKPRPYEHYPSLMARLDPKSELVPLLAERFSFRFNPETRRVEGLLAPEDRHLETTGIHINKEKAL